MANKRLDAKTSRRRSKPSGGGSSFDYASVLVGIFIFLTMASIAWYVWPRPSPGLAQRENQQKLKQLTTQHPDAEVFDLGSSEKKN